jgi:class 3 adenylate cyclase
MEPLRVDSTVMLASSAADVWPLLVDTDRLNRLLGMKPVTYTAVPDEDEKTGARLLAETVLGGFRVTYEELPYEWTYRKRFGVRRNFNGGPLEWLRLEWALEPRADVPTGCLLHLTIEALPRLIILRPVAWLNLKRSIAGFIDLGKRIDAHLHDSAPNPFAEPVSPSDPVALARAVQVLTDERKVGKDLAQKLGELVRTSPDADCMRIRPFDVADKWHADRRTILVAFLQAVAAGLVELRWSIVCPSCRTQAEAVPALEDIGTEGHCQMCDIAFELDLDRAVEATFTPAEAIRKVPKQMFCIAGPARTPHVLSQVNVPHGDMAVLEAPPDIGRYRIFSRGGARATLEITADAPATATIGMDDSKIEQAVVSVAPFAELVIDNHGAETRHVKIERIEYSATAATAHELSTIPEFRRIFSKELLKRGTPLKVARASILFTDLTGSTQLYSVLGDAVAFRFVDDHFDVLRKAIGDNGGVVVKTMGDAVMAAFTDETAALRGAIACMEGFEAFRRSSPSGNETFLKLGIFAGPSYVVTANGALDYFGQTVNVASRLQHVAAAGELVLEDKMIKLLPPTDRERVTVSGAADVRVKGIAAKLHIIRVRLRGASQDISSTPSIEVSPHSIPPSRSSL